MADRVVVGFLVVLGAVFGVGILAGKGNANLVSGRTNDDSRLDLPVFLQRNCQGLPHRTALQHLTRLSLAK